ncbi:hypothetical protein L9F63_012171, partial [Diploptera punctata]
KLYTTSFKGHHPHPQPKLELRMEAMYDYPFYINLQHRTAVSRGNIKYKISRPREEFRCERCNNVYIHHKSLVRHVRMECGVEPQFQCPTCNRRCKLHCNLLKHIRKCQHKFGCMQIHSLSVEFFGNSIGSKGDGGYLYQNILSECGGKTRYTSNTDNNGSNNLNYLEQQVTQMLRGDQGISNIAAGNIWRERERKSGFGSFQCPGCGKVYRWRKNMISHMRLECGKEPQFQCPHCPQRTTQKSIHSKTVRKLMLTLNIVCWFPNGEWVLPKEKILLVKYPCVEANSQDYYRANNTNFTCSDCGKTYSWKTSLIRHKREECGREPHYQCPFCCKRTKLR